MAGVIFGFVEDGIASWALEHRIWVLFGSIGAIRRHSAGVRAARVGPESSLRALEVRPMPLEIVDPVPEHSCRDGELIARIDRAWRNEEIGDAHVARNGHRGAVRPCACGIRA